MESGSLDRGSFGARSLDYGSLTCHRPYAVICASAWDFGGSSSGRTRGSGPRSGGSNPPPPATHSLGVRALFARPHRLEAQDTALSRLKHGFESRWGHQLIFVDVFCEGLPLSFDGDGSPTERRRQLSLVSCVRSPWAAASASRRGLRHLLILCLSPPAGAFLAEERL